MKFSLFGYVFSVGSETPGAALSKQGAAAKRDRSWQKIEAALIEITEKQIKYSEYRVQKISGVSINTVKKYREQIQAYRAENNRDLFS